MKMAHYVCSSSQRASSLKSWLPPQQKLRSPGLLKRFFSGNNWGMESGTAEQVSNPSLVGPIWRKYICASSGRSYLNNVHYALCSVRRSSKTFQRGQFRELRLGNGVKSYQDEHLVGRTVHLTVRWVDHGKTMEKGERRLPRTCVVWVLRLEVNMLIGIYGVRSGSMSARAFRVGVK